MEINGLSPHLVFPKAQGKRGHHTEGRAVLFALQRQPVGFHLSAPHPVGMSVSPRHSRIKDDLHGIGAALNQHNVVNPHVAAP